MIFSSDKPRYSNTVVEFPPPLRQNPCANGLFQLISLMRVRTSARPRALATLARSFPLPDSPQIPNHQPTPPYTPWLARFARFAFAPGARSALRALGGRLASRCFGGRAPLALRCLALRPPLRPPGRPRCWRQAASSSGGPGRAVGSVFVGSAPA